MKPTSKQTWTNSFFLLLEFTVERPQEYGGIVTFKNYESIEESFAKEVLIPFKEIEEYFQFLERIIVLLPRFFFVGEGGGCYTIWVSLVKRILPFI